MKHYKTKFNIDKRIWYLIPTITIYFNNPFILGKNLMISIHFLCFSLNILFRQEPRIFLDEFTIRLNEKLENEVKEMKRR